MSQLSENIKGGVGGFLINIVKVGVVKMRYTWLTVTSHLYHPESIRPSNISKHIWYIKPNIGCIRLQLRQHGEKLFSPGRDLSTPYQQKAAGGWVQQPDGPAGHGD